MPCERIMGDTCSVYLLSGQWSVAMGDVRWTVGQVIIVQLGSLTLFLFLLVWDLFSAFVALGIEPRAVYMPGKEENCAGHSPAVVEASGLIGSEMLPVRWRRLVTERGVGIMTKDRVMWTLRSGLRTPGLGAERCEGTSPAMGLSYSLQQRTMSI